MIKKEINIFLTALMFYTRIPCPKRVDYSADILNKATRYFPLIGWIVGGFSAGIFWLADMVFSDTVAILLSMVGSIIITGAFHEDGFADVCDGFGGGWTKKDRLHIMKDSRIGTYGTVGLIFILLTKFLFLKELTLYSLPLIILVAHSFSRFIPIIVVFFGKYSRDDLTSKVKPIGRKISLAGFLTAFIISILPILLFQNLLYFCLIILPLVSGLWLMRYFNKRIDGYTGDCLGTIQQVSEIGIYISILLLYKYF